MARLFDDASSQYLELASAPVNAPPLTISAWIRPDANPAGTIVSIMNSGTASRGFRLERQVTRNLRFITLNGGTTGIATSGATTAADNVWSHALAVTSAVDSRALFLNGTKFTNTTSVTPSATPDVTAIGRVGGASPGTYWSGDLAEVTLWNVALNDTEAAALSRGVPSRLIRPESIVAYWPVWGLHSPEIDLTANNRVMVVAGATASNHAPVPLFMPLRMGTYPEDIVVAGGGGGSRSRNLLLGVGG